MSATTTPSSTASHSEKQQSPSSTAISSILENEFVNNPGPYEDLHKKTKELSPIYFEGFKFSLNKMLSSHFQVSHAVTLSSIAPSGYKFGATFVGTKALGPNEMTPVILGDIDFSGSMNAQMIHQFSRALRSRVVAQIQESHLVAYQATTDYKGRDYTVSLTAAQNDIIKNSGILIGHYLQRVTRNLDLGSELVFQYGPQVPNHRTAQFSLGWRYFKEQWQLTGAISPAGSLHVCYHHVSKLSPLQLGVELETSLRDMESVCTLNYQIDLPKSGFVFKGMINSNWSVGGVLEKRLSPQMPFTLVLSGFLNHTKPSYKFGIGFNIG